MDLGLQMHTLAKSQVTGRRTDAQGAQPGRGFPPCIPGGPVLQLAWGDVHRDGARLAGTQVDAVKGDQRAQRKLHAVGNH